MSSRQKPVVQPGRAAGAAQPLGRDEPLLCLLEARIPQQEPDCCHGLDEEHLTRVRDADQPDQRGGGGERERSLHLARGGE